MLAGILDLVKADKAALDARPARQAALGLLHLALAAPLVDRQREFGVHQLDAVLAAAVLLFECVHAREAEVHSVRVREVLEEGEQLDYVVLVHDLQADGIGCPLLVDWDHHAAAGDGERACNSNLVSTASSERFHENKEEYEPIELDVEASNGELERMQIFERVESQATDSCCVCQGAQQFGQRIGDSLVCTAAVHGDGHVLLGVAEKGEVCSTVDWEAHKDLTGTWRC